ncbi:hypothetical protein GBA52_024929 [Prunus armeniaca]|nr:hypothetical protein GBA52_024929 [Prunus armeniaca]
MQFNHNPVIRNLWNQSRLSFQLFRWVSIVNPTPPLTTNLKPIDLAFDLDELLEMDGSENKKKGWEEIWPISPAPIESRRPHWFTWLLRLFFPSKAMFILLGTTTVSLNIGHPAKIFELDIDSGSDLTWVQCDAPCTGCTEPREHLYRPNNNLLQCKDLLCTAFHSPASHPCETTDDQCDYEVKYADHGSSLGVLVKDYFPLKFTNGSLLSLHLAFGCGYDQKYFGPVTPATAGVIGLGNGKVSILSQLSRLGLTRNVVGHCLSGRGGGFLFFGDDLSVHNPWHFHRDNNLMIFIFRKRCSCGPAELVFDGKATSVKGLDMIFDSGSSYNYFNSQAYQAIVTLVRNDLKGKPLKDATEDQSLPICWKGRKPFKFVRDAKNYFKPLSLSFTNAKNVQRQLSPQTYLIVTKHGNVCLGILNGTEVGLGNLNIIGDITLQDKMLIYDNENQRIGWAPANCNTLPKSRTIAIIAR